MTIPFHPLADLFPLIEGEAFAELVADVAAHGIREPIKLLDGQILDGRNRYRAAVAAGLIGADESPWRDGEPGTGLKPSFALFMPKHDGEPLSFVLSRNLHRRHLSESQRAMVAAGIANLSHGGDRITPPPADEQAANLPVAVTQGDAARMLQVSERSVRTAKEVRAAGVPELGEAVTRGEVAVSAAAEIARLPAEDQARLLADVARAPDTRRAFAAAAKELRAERQAEKRDRRETREAELGARQAALPEKRYGVILADPEWRFEPWSRETGMDRAADNHYPTSAVEALMARPVGDIAAADCALLLWATVPMLPQALAVMSAWGFAYASHVVWLKDRVGTGYWFRNQHEILLLGTRGAIPAPAAGTQFRSALAFDTGAHSAKPAFAHEIAEAYFPTLPKIELNARARRNGWDAWGLEAPPEEPAALPPAPEPPPAAPAGGAAATDDLDIPTFLRRGHPDCTLGTGGAG